LCLQVKMFLKHYSYCQSSNTHKTVSLQGKWMVRLRGEGTKSIWTRMLRTVKGQSWVLLGWKTFVSVLYFHSTEQNPPTVFSLGSSRTLRLLHGSWRCPVISSPNNKLQPQMEAHI
jgi:hypothetical protein